MAGTVVSIFAVQGSWTILEVLLGMPASYNCTTIRSYLILSLILCRGAVRTRVEMSQFLLPYLVVDVLAFPPCEHNDEEEADAQDPDADRSVMVKSIVEEICAALNFGSDQDRADSRGGISSSLTATFLSTKRSSGKLGRGMLDRAAIAGFRGSDNASSHMCVQSVFTLLDTLEKWRGSQTTGTSTKGDIALFADIYVLTV